MKKVIIIRYAELFLKGKNRGFFERVFSMNIEKALRGIRHELHRYSGRYLVEGFDEEETETIVSRLKKVFGDRKSTRLNSSHRGESRMPSCA